MQEVKQIKMLIIEITPQVLFSFITLEKLSFAPYPRNTFLIIIIPSLFRLSLACDEFGGRHEQKVINSVGHVALHQLRDDFFSFSPVKEDEER